MALLKSISPSSLSDAELVTLYQRNSSQDVLAQLFLRYSDLVYGCCIKYLADQETAKDAVMNIYQELVEKLKNHTVENFKSWLYVVSKNHCLMQLRKNKKNPLSEFKSEFMQSEDFSHLDNALEKEQQLTRLEYCIERLNTDQRESVRLFYLENKCYNEITDLTGNDWNKVRSLIQNARRNLKTCMEQHG
jgi:RNA polymerase sigma factor (sigma-70 family)